MKLSEACRRLLERMRIDVVSYESQLEAYDGQSTELLDELFGEFGNFNYETLNTNCFIEFMGKQRIPDDSSLYNHAYDMFNYLRLYKSGGVFELFKCRQAEWNGPTVKIQKEDVPPSDIGSLPNEFFVFRGMSSEEIEKNSYGQSWSLNLEVARRFAFTTYHDKSRGIVARSRISREHVLYYSSADHESEVIVKSGSIETAETIEM